MHRDQQHIRAHWHQKWHIPQQWPRQNWILGTGGSCGDSAISAWVCTWLPKLSRKKLSIINLDISIGLLLLLLISQLYIIGYFLVIWASALDDTKEKQSWLPFLLRWVQLTTANVFISAQMQKHNHCILVNSTMLHAGSAPTHADPP